MECFTVAVVDEPVAIHGRFSERWRVQYVLVWCRCSRHLENREIKMIFCLRTSRLAFLERIIYLDDSYGTRNASCILRHFAYRYPPVNGALSLQGAHVFCRYRFCFLDGLFFLLFVALI